MKKTLNQQKKLGRPINGKERKKTVAITIEPSLWLRLTEICKKLKVSKSEWIEERIRTS